MAPNTVPSISDLQIPFKEENKNESKNTPQLHSIGMSVIDIGEENYNNKGSLVTTGKSNLTFEKLLEDQGCFGRFQILVLCTYLFMEIPGAFVAFISIFLTRGATFVNCTNHGTSSNAIETNSTVDVTLFTTSSQNASGDSKSYFSSLSIIDEWDLTCDRAWIPEMFTSMLMAGMIVGELVCSSISDWYGRRKAFLIFAAINAVSSLVSALSPNIFVYAGSRFFAGAGFCVVHIATMAVLEFMTPKWRSLASCAGPMGEGTIILAVLAYFVQPWRKLHLVALFPYIMLVPAYFMLPESPRWLLRNNKVLEAHSVMRYMAKVNGKEPVPLSVLEELRHQEAATSASTKTTKISYLDFFRTPSLRVTALNMMAIWFAWMMCYFGITYSIQNVPGNICFNIGLTGLSNGIGQRVAMPAAERLGRRKSVLLGMTIAAVSLVGVAVYFLVVSVVDPNVITVACVAGLFGLGLLRVAGRLLSGESFPTSARSMGFAVGGFGGNVAGLLTPHIASLGSENPSIPFFIFAGVSVIASLVVLMMKETKGSPLTDEIEVKSDKKVTGKH